MAPYVHRWSAGDPRCIVLIAHGYGEHAGRYEHVAQHLVHDLDAAVYAPDHRGHGRTDGAIGLVEDGEAITTTCTTSPPRHAPSTRRCPSRSSATRWAA